MTLFQSVGTPIDVSEGRCNSQNNENCIMAMPDAETLAIGYSPGLEAASATFKVRLLDVNALTLGTPIDTGLGTSDYHAQGSLFADMLGRLHAMQGGGAWKHTSVAAPTTFGSPAALTVRSGAVQLGGGSIIDASGVLDPFSGDLFCTFQHNGTYRMDGYGVAAPGVSLAPAARSQWGCLWRIPAGAQVGGPILPDGPYKLIDSGFSLQIKRQLVIGKETSGQRSLHLMWILRYSFTTLPSDFATYNIYYMKSTDGGTTWKNAAGDISLPKTGNGISILAYPYPGTSGSPTDGNSSFQDTLQDSLGVAIPPHPIAAGDWRNFDAFRVFAGNVGQGCEGAFDLDEDGYPMVVFAEYVSGGNTATAVAERAAGGLPYDPPATMVGIFASTAVYRLSHRRWNGSAWIGGVIDDSRNYLNAIPKLRIDANGRAIIFMSIPAASLGLRVFTLDRDEETWEGPTAIVESAEAEDARLIWSLRDPFNADRHWIAFNTGNDDRWLLPLQLTASVAEVNVANRIIAGRPPASIRHLMPRGVHF